MIILVLPAQPVEAQKLGKYLSCYAYNGEAGVDIYGGSIQSPAISGPESGRSGSLRFSLYATNNLNMFKQGTGKAYLLGQERFAPRDSDEKHKSIELEFEMPSGAASGQYYLVAVLEERTSQGWQYSHGVYWGTFQWTGRAWVNASIMMYTTEL